MSTTTQTYQPETPFHLRALSVNKALSEETMCFSADLYKGSEKIGTVGNRGHGGCHEIHYSDRDLGAEYEQYAKDMPEAHFPEEWGGGTYERGVDGLTDLLVAEAEAYKNAAKWLTFVDKADGVERGYLEIKRGRKKVPVTDTETRDRTLADNPEFLWVDPSTVR